MPKRDGILKCFSFNLQTINKIKILCDKLKFNQTSLLEYLINKEFRKQSKGD